MLRKKLKKWFPEWYEWYLHMQRRRCISIIKKRKKLQPKQYEQEISRQYQQRIGHELNWNNLETYTEKMQWAKLYDKDPRKSELTDKYKVREWVARRIGEDYLINLLGVWDCFEDIDFSKLPNRFVLKTNHGSGTNLIVKDKNQLDIKWAKCKFKDWLDTDFGYKSMELHYSKISPRKIIAEEYIETDQGELQDYKFLCFGGTPYYCWVDMGRYSNHTRNVYNLAWQLQPWNQETYAHYEKPIEKPKNFEKMIEIVKILAHGFSHVRVDLYNIKEKIYFGEMTFTNGGGFDRIIPAEYDKLLGDFWELPLATESKGSGAIEK